MQGECLVSAALESKNRCLPGVVLAQDHCDTLSYCFASWLSKITAFGSYKENELVWQIDGLMNMNMEKECKATVVKGLWGSCCCPGPYMPFLPSWPAWCLLYWYSRGYCTSVLNSHVSVRVDKGHA